jgi:hypothetical protein
LFSLCKEEEHRLCLVCCGAYENHSSLRIIQVILQEITYYCCNTFVSSLLFYFAYCKYFKGNPMTNFWNCSYIKNKQVYLSGSCSSSHEISDFIIQSIATFQLSTATHFLNCSHRMWQYVLAVKDKPESFPIIHTQCTTPHTLQNWKLVYQVYMIFFAKTGWCSSIPIRQCFI